MPVRVGEIAIFPEEHRVTARGHEIALTPREFDLLHTLLRSPRRVFSREALVEHAYGGETVSGRTVDSHIKGIRRQFLVAGTALDPIDTVYGVGYRAAEGHD